MKHNLKISVSEAPPPDGIVHCRKVSIREKLLNKLFGCKTQMMILVPGCSVATVAIAKEQEGGYVCE